MAFFNYYSRISNNRDMLCFQSTRRKFRFQAKTKDSLNYLSRIQIQTHSQSLSTFEHYENNVISDKAYIFHRPIYTKLSDVYRYRRYNKVTQLYGIVRSGIFYRVVFVK